ncbi:MAG: peptidylprolyl isomerase [Alphaproteobacteria bacterium]|nr:peptidylprolyl isomerase [Alphaproteobacteria bacterium]
MPKASLRAAAFALAVAVGVPAMTPAIALAQGQAAPAEDPVVARVNGSEILRSEVLAAIEALPQQYRQLPMPVLYNGMLTQLIDRKLLSQAAVQAKLREDAEVKRRMVQAEERVLQEVFVTREVEKGLTDAKIKSRYDQLVKEQPPQEEIRARHILVDDEAKANRLVAELKKGTDFAKLAKDNSSGPSAASGGDLGFFTKEQMVPEFSEAAFALKAGSYTEKPVKTQFGWHVIKVEERRTAPPPAIEEMRDDIRRELAQEMIGEMVGGLRSKAKIERFDETGKPQPAPEAQPGKN